MRKASTLVLVLMIILSAQACAISEYPRKVSTIEKGYTNLGAAIDTAGAEVIPKFIAGRRYRRQRQTPWVEYSFYWDLKFKKEPELFYVKPQGLPDVQVVKRLVKYGKIRVDLIKWHSQYWPQNPDFELYYKTYTPVHTAYAIHAYRKSGNRGAVVISHDWTSDDITKVWRKEKMTDLAKLGYDSVLIQQPYHGFRALPDMAYSGEYFISGEVARINEAMCQSVTDVRSMVNWLKKSHKVVGVKGRGMGGTTSLMTAVVEEDIDFVVAWSPPASLGDILQETPQAPYVLEAVRLSGLDEDMIRKIVWLSSPANYEPAISTDDVLVIAGMGDKLVPPEQPIKIMRRWGPFDVYWYAGGHTSNFQKRRCKRKERYFLVDHLPEVK